MYSWSRRTIRLVKGSDGGEKFAEKHAYPRRGKSIRTIAREQGVGIGTVSRLTG